MRFQAHSVHLVCGRPLKREREREREKERKRIEIIIMGTKYFIVNLFSTRITNSFFFFCVCVCVCVFLRVCFGIFLISYNMIGIAKKDTKSLETIIRLELSLYYISLFTHTHTHRWGKIIYIRCSILPRSQHQEIRSGT